VTADSPSRTGEAESAVLRVIEALAESPELPTGPAAREPQAGNAVGRFTIGRTLGQGGFGIVYEARDGELGRRVALKLLRAHREASTDEIARFRTEAAAAGATQPPQRRHLARLRRVERPAVPGPRAARG
jgi:hypothetical protein